MSKHIALAILLALGAANLGVIDTAWAETPEEQQACTNDAFQFCQNAIPDRDKVFTCLASNRSQISSACRAVITRGRDEASGIRACARKNGQGQGPAQHRPSLARLRSTGPQACRIGVSMPSRPTP